MSLIKKMRKQKAVYWAPLEADGFGRAPFDTPIEIKCRWEDGVFETIDAMGTVVRAKSRVYVDRVLAIGGLLLLSTLENVPEDKWPIPRTLDPRPQEIKVVEQLPNLKARETLLTAYLDG